MQFLSTIVAVICLTFSAITMAAPQGFISQEKCNNAGSYGCGGSNNIIFNRLFAAPLASGSPPLSVAATNTVLLLVANLTASKISNSKSTSTTRRLD
ncbi:hypothetical protein ACEPPN_005031 [Leptodophora sp. 'Broadleaf-Isolate-01']